MLAHIKITLFQPADVDCDSPSLVMTYSSAITLVCHCIISLSALCGDLADVVHANQKNFKWNHHWTIPLKTRRYCKYNHRHWSEVDRTLFLQTPFVTCLPQMLPLLNCLPRHHHQEQHYQYSSINEYHTLHSSLSLFWQLLSNFNVFMLYKSWVIS